MMKINLYRLPLMLFALVILTAAAWAGLIRLGWRLPALQPTLALNHGPLMVAGFFGTLISLERAVAMGKRWTYLSPLMSGLGGLLVAFGVNGFAGPVLITLGSVWLVLIFVVVLQQHWAGYTVVMAGGALALFVGNLLWLLGWPVHQFVLWWAAFLILTIAGERLELSRMVQLSRRRQIGFTAVILIYVAGLLVLLPAWDLGVRITGVGMIGLALWLLLYDIARRTVKQTGLTRFIAVCLLSGYVWLGVSGVVGLFYGGLQAGPIYDTMLHAIFLGFVFVMVFGHAPIIFPAVLGFDIDYKSYFYFPLILLHSSLILRLGGEMLGWGWARAWGGLINEIAVLLYLGMIAPITIVRKAG
ncbi:MAG: hypothetical protein H8E28_08390 [Anaerolineae bacterium]|nr:hypothetical protein [Anaerolineae bacterium]